MRMRACFTNRLPWVTTCRVGLAPPSLRAILVGQAAPYEKPALCIVPWFEPDLDSHWIKFLGRFDWPGPHVLEWSVMIHHKKICG